MPEVAVTKDQKICIAQEITFAKYPFATIRLSGVDLRVRVKTDTLAAAFFGGA